jgi:hypothetical protein
MLMTGTLVNQILDKHGRYSEETPDGYTSVQVATIVAFAVGFWQVQVVLL